MPKRKKLQTVEQPKKPRIDSTGEISSPAILTKQPKHLQKENIPWPDRDILQLLKNIEENIPKDDTLSYSCRLEKINWEIVAFAPHSVEECQEIWGQLYKQVRKFRFLNELVTDIKELVQAQPPDEPRKHPDKPKHPRNSFMLFVDDKRPEVVRENPTLSAMEVSKKLGQMYKDIPAEEKEKYENKAKAVRQDYLVKLQTFYEEHPEMIPKKTNKRRKSVYLEEGRGPLEKPKTPFELFVHVEAEKQESKAARYVLVQKCKDRWNEMSDKAKFFWINWAQELYAKYVDDMKEYVKKHPNYEPDKLKPILTKKEQKIKERCSGKPDRPPAGAYHLFFKMMTESEEVRNINSKDLMNYVSEKWKASSEQDKNQYKIRLDQMWEEYDRKLDEYVRTLPPEERDKVLDLEKQRKNKTEKKVAARKESPVGLKKPEPPPSTPHKYFLKVYQGTENPCNVWKSMTEEEKKVFREKLDQERKTYIGLYETYLKSLSREELEKLGASLGSQHGSTSDSESATSEEED